MNGSVHTGAPLHHQASLNQPHTQQQKPQPVPHQTTHHQMQPTNDHVSQQQRVTTTAPQTSSHQTTHHQMQPTNDHLTQQQRVPTTTPQQRTSTTPQQQKINEQQRR